MDRELTHSAAFGGILQDCLAVRPEASVAQHDCDDPRQVL